MRGLFFLAVLIFSAVNMTQAQIMQRLQSAAPEQRKEMIKQMSPDERKVLIKQLRDNAVIEDLKIEEGNQEEFKKLYNEYLASQRQIKNSFRTDFDPETLSDEEARKKLDESFVYGEKLIQNRRTYAGKMSRVMKPQQMLKMFRNEGMMKDKMIDRHLDMRLKEDSAKYRESKAAGFRRGNIGK